MVSFGCTWEAKLKRLWKDSSLSLSEVGRRLGIDPLTARRHATRLKLPFSGSRRKIKPLKRVVQFKGHKSSDTWQKKRHTYRSKWICGKAQDLKVTLKELRHELTREYAWLSQNDSEWLISNKPQSQNRARNKSSVDWKRRDSQYASAVKVSASRLKETRDRPVQVTKTAIGRDLGAVTLLQQKLHKMPLTAQVLGNAMETREQYAVRRIQWAANLYAQEKVLPREWQLRLRANVYVLRSSLTVKTAIEHALRMIKWELPLNG
jgi:hypothetical protein